MVDDQHVTRSGGRGAQTGSVSGPSDGVAKKHLAVAVVGSIHLDVAVNDDEQCMRQFGLPTEQFASVERALPKQLAYLFDFALRYAVENLQRAQELRNTH